MHVRHCEDTGEPALRCRAEAQAVARDEQSDLPRRNWREIGRNARAGSFVELFRRRCLQFVARQPDRRIRIEQERGHRSDHRTSGPYFLSSRSAHSGSAGSVRSRPGGTKVMSFSAPRIGWRQSLVTYGLAKPPFAPALATRRNTSLRALISTRALS